MWSHCTQIKNHFAGVEFNQNLLESISLNWINCGICQFVKNCCSIKKQQYTFSVESRLDIAHEYGDKFRLNVMYDGVIDWAPALKFQTHCVVDLGLFPFDVQTCYIQFLSIVYSIFPDIGVRFVNSTVRDYLRIFFLLRLL